MLNWSTAVVDELAQAVKEHDFWRDYLNDLWSDGITPFSIHLAIFVEPFLRYMLDGSKTLESRFSSVRCAPYQSVKRGDVVLLKRAGGPIVGLCQITRAWFYELDKESWREIRSKYKQALRAEDPKFWKERESASYATLMRFNQVNTINPISVQKRDRRGWVVLQDASPQLLFAANR